MKWLRYLSVILIPVCLFSLLIPLPVQAANPIVNITVRAWVIGNTELTLTWVSDTEIRLDWTRGAAAVNTMIRAKIGSAPEDRDDGYLVYSGNATTCTDTAVDLDIIGGFVYYKAWSQNADGVWEESGDTGYIGGVGMTLIAIIILVIGMTWFAYIRTSIATCGIAALLWLFLWSYTRSNPIPGTTTGDFADQLVYYVCILMAIGIFFIYLSRRYRTKNLESRGYIVDESGRVSGSERRTDNTPISPSNMSPEDYRRYIRSKVIRRRR